MTRKNSFDDLIGGWERLLAAVHESEGMFPAAEEHRALLKWHLQEVKAAKARQQHHSAGRRQATQDVKQFLAAGSDAAIRLRSLVKSALGPRDERLEQFGIAPIKRGARKARASRKQQPSAGPGTPEPAK